MYFKNMKEKMKFIDNLYEDDNESVEKKIPILFRLSKDKNPDVRVNLASQLFFFDNIEIEDILYNLLFDKNRRVRLEAVDCLSIGRQIKSIEKMKTMLEGEGYLIRTYAVSTIFSLIVNHYGVNKSALKKYEEAVSQSYLTEKNPRVLLTYYKNYFFIDGEKGLRLLENAYMQAVEKKNYELIWPLLHIFQEIQNRKNEKRINKILSYQVENLLSVQRELVIKMIRNVIPWRILIIDEENVYLSHVVSSVLSSMNIPDIEISTAGVNVGHVWQPEILAFCNRHSVKVSNNYYSKKITDAHLYDYIIFLNTEISREKYSLCKVFYYEKINIDNDREIIEICKHIKQLLKL